MKNHLKGGVGALLIMASGAVNAQQINPMTEAVLRDYAEILAENPKDYLTLYDRASQYLSLGEYARALSDIDMALEYTPESDKDYRLAEYSLKADILTALNKYEDAIAAINSALKINPTSPSELYTAGNLYLLANEPREALKAFQALQRESPRSQEAFYGMAKANVMIGNNDAAAQLIPEIENLGKQSFVTYCRIGDLYSDMKNIKDATTNYAIAFTMEDKNYRPVESLKLLAKKNSGAVMDALDGIINSNSDNMALNYLKAMVAFDRGLYVASENACRALITGMEEESAPVYRMLAMSQLRQNKVEEAISSIENAERISPNDAGVMLDKAEIFSSLNPEEAYKAAKKAMQLDSADEATLVAGAKAAMQAGYYPDAQALLNEVVLSNPSNAEALLLRGYLNTEYLKDGKAGVADYTRAGNAEQNGEVRSLVLAALGKAKVNKKLDAEGMVNDAIAKATSGDDFYLIAVYYAQTGNLEKAKEYVDKAKSNGYTNLYNLQTDTEPLLNLQPIRHLM